MNTTGKLRDPSFWYRIFKYSVYCLLAYNAWLFFLEDLGASAQTFTGGITWRNVVEAYSATFDTLSWVVLLILFELETAVIPDEKLQGSLKWILGGLRFACYLFISYSLYGYILKYGVVTNHLPMDIAHLCSSLVGDFTFVKSLDDYPLLTPEACNLMLGQPVHQIVGTQIVGTLPQLEVAKALAITDIVNGSDWLIVVVILEGEVWLQLNNRLTSGLLTINKFAKGVLYAVLFVCAVYWGIDGTILDFWDAILWLVAFIFIELNIFEWQAEEIPDSA